MDVAIRPGSARGNTMWSTARPRPAPSTWAASSSETAHVDGAGRGRAVLHIVLPLALPGLIATSIFTFTLAWNDYIFTRILIASDDLKTLPVGVQDLFAAAVVDWGLVMAAGMLITIPALAFFMAVQRHLVA